MMRCAHFFLCSTSGIHFASFFARYQTARIGTKSQTYQGASTRLSSRRIEVMIESPNKPQANRAANVTL